MQEPNKIDSISGNSENMPNYSNPCVNTAGHQIINAMRNVYANVETSTSTSL